MAFASRLPTNTNTDNIVISHASVTTIVIAMAREWFENVTNTSRSQSLSNSLTKQLKLINTISKDKHLENAKSDYFSAFKHKKQFNSFQKYIQSSYNKCCSIQSNINIYNLDSNDKLFLYSLLISCGFIYHSDFGQNLVFINGLKQIYHILCQLNNDIKLRKDLNTALGAKIFWTDFERKLINESVCFANRINTFIQQIQHHIQMDILCENDIIYLDIDWVPRYYDGYYYGKVCKKICKYPKLCAKDLQNVMHAEKAPNRIFIDDLVIHTNNLANSGIYIKEHKQYIHHWYSDIDWIDFDYINMFKINIQMTNNGKVYELMVNLYDSVKRIKRKIGLEEGDIPTVMIKMTYNDKRLDDEMTLYDYNISQDCWVKATLMTFDPFLNFLS
eukprot:239255_1